MGLIHANHYDQETKAYLLEQLHNAQATEVLQHGACLGLGLLCMATADERIYDELTQTLYTDTAVAGEAAAYAIGLVMVGSASQKAIDESSAKRLQYFILYLYFCLTCSCHGIPAFDCVEHTPPAF
eukprot:g7152.t1